MAKGQAPELFRRNTNVVGYLGDVCLTGNTRLAHYKPHSSNNSLSVRKHPNDGTATEAEQIWL